MLYYRYEKCLQAQVLGGAIAQLAPQQRCVAWQDVSYSSFFY
jgi:hypothetical protein